MVSLVDHLENCVLFSDSQFGFRFSQSIAGLLTVVSDRFTWAFNGTDLLDLQHLIYPKLLAGFGVPIIFIDLSLVEFYLMYLVLFCLFSGISS